MQREAWKVGLACAVGALIGTFTALEMSHAFWWIGLLVGGLTGYLSYEWRRVLAAIPAAYTAARGWHPNKNPWKAAFWTYLVFISAIFDFFVLVFIVSMGYVPWIFSAQYAIAASCLAGVLTFIVILGFALDLNHVIDEHVLYGLRLWTFYVFPPILFFWHIPRWIWKARRLIVPTITKFGGFTRRFVWHFFLHIYSEIRLLCGLGAALGTTVGYFAGSAVIGAAAGATIGLVQYLFVTKLWLERAGYLRIRNH